MRPLEVASSTPAPQPRRRKPPSLFDKALAIVMSPSLFLFGCFTAAGLPGAVRHWLQPNWIDVGWIVPLFLLVTALAFWLCAFGVVVSTFCEPPPRKPQRPRSSVSDGNPFNRG